MPCSTVHVATDTTAFTAGGLVTVTVECDVPLNDLGLLGIGAHHTVTSRQATVIDRYRGL